MILWLTVLAIRQVMTCSGCSGAIDRVLKKTEGTYLPRRFYSSAGSLSPSRADTPRTVTHTPSALCFTSLLRSLDPCPGVTSHDISLEKQEVLVKATIPYDDVLAKIKKTGKEVKSGTVVA